MPRYDSIVWLPNALVMTALLAVATWFVWRARGRRAGVRMVGVTLIPMALYFTGLLRLIWMMVYQVSVWASGFVFRPGTWVGVALGVVGLALIVGGGRLGRRNSREQRPAAARTKKSRESSGDEDIDEIDAILKRHGIE